MFKHRTNKEYGITIISLVVTIIVLLILAGISVMMISGNNGILNRSGDTKKLTKETQKYEEIHTVVLGSYDKSANLDIDDLLANLNEIKDITVTPTQKNGTNTFPVTVATENKTYEITSDGDFEEIIIADRTGISVGDYITYTSPTASVTFTDADTGYSTYATTPATLTAKDTFRVMDIDSNGNMTLIGAMSSADLQIYFSGAKGYNNAVYTLNKKCSDLYEDTTKGITARSIKVEDITSKFNDTGNGKITTYISNNLPTLTGTYITNIDTVNKTVTYQTRTNYPDIFQYEAGGLIDSTATSGVIGQSDSYSGYNGLTDLASKKATTNLTVPYTYYNTKHAAGDFEDSAKAAAYQNMFFGTGTYYWLASRCIYCNSDYALFGVRFVNNSNLSGASLSYSYDRTYDSLGRVCPVVYLPSSVNITVSKDTSTYHQEHPHEVQ